MADNPDEVEITIWDADGNVVVQESTKCFTATQEEIDFMVDLISKGLTAEEARLTMMANRKEE